MRSLVAVAAGPSVPCPGLHALDDGLSALPGLGAGHQPLQCPRPVPLLLQLPHRPQQLLPELHQLLLQPLDLQTEVCKFTNWSMSIMFLYLSVLLANSASQVRLLGIESDSQLVDTLQVRDDPVPGHSVGLEVGREAVNLTGEA